MTLEGSAQSKFVQVIRKYGRNPYDKYEFASVKSISPLLIRVDGMKIDLEANDCVVAERLTDHSVTLRYADDSSEVVTIESGLRVDDRVIVVSASDMQKYFVIDRVGGVI